MTAGNTTGHRELPSVSLIISNRNGRELLRDCLTSLMKQDYPRYEVIVVDAASNDGAPEMVEEEFPSVILVREKLIGVGEAINRGIEVATGEILALDLNNDEIFPSDWLATLVRGLLSSGETAVVGGTRVIYDSHDIVDEAGVRDFLPVGYFDKVGHGRPLSKIPPGPHEVVYVGCPVFKKNLLKLIGPCDTMYQFYFEDVDFCTKAHFVGYRILNIPQAISYHRIGSTFGAASPRAYYFQSRGRIRYVTKFFSLKRLLPSLLWWFLISPLIDAFASFPPIQRIFKHTRLSFLVEGVTIDHFKSTLKGVCWNFRNIRRHFSDRWRLQQLFQKALMKNVRRISSYSEKEHSNQD